MTMIRKTWQTPELSEVSVQSVLGPETRIGPMGPGLIAGPNPNFSLEGPRPAPAFGPPVIDPAFGPPSGGATFGPPVPAPAFGPPTGGIAFGPRVPAPAFGPPAVGVVFDGPRPPPAQTFFGPQPSDVRLKEDVSRIGVTAHGLPLYSFRYRGQEGLYEGVMAQDVLDVRPDAVSIGDDGYYRVDYARLGIAFRRTH